MNEDGEKGDPEENPRSTRSNSARLFVRRSNAPSTGYLQLNEPDWLLEEGATHLVER